MGRMSMVRLADVKKEYTKTAQPTYIGLRLDGPSMDALMQYATGVPECIPKGMLHITLIYSKEPIVYTERGKLVTPFELKVKGKNVFMGGDGCRCMVLELECDELVNRHQQLRAETGASHDYPDYIPHITLSYNLGDYDVESHPDVENIPPLKATYEYAAPLQLDWHKKKH